MKGIKEIFGKLKEFILNNILLTILFLISTIFFISQHYLDLSWDFSAYVINAKFFFYGGDYYEVYRAPLISIFLGIFLILSKFGEYLYILFVCVLFFYSNIRLSKTLYEKYFYKYNIEKRFFVFLFYFFSLNPFLLYHGLIIGTELLGLAFFELFLAAYIKNKNSGHYLGLAFLSRYNLLFFSVLLLFNKNYKKIIKNILLMFIIILPWLVYNYIVWGNFFTSIVDSYFLNVYNRISISEPFNFLSLILPINWFLPFLIVGILYVLFEFFKLKKRRFSDNKIILLFIFIYILVFLDCYNTPFKISRYMFNMTLPIAFFSTIGMIYLLNKFKNKMNIILTILMIAFIVSTFILFYGFFLNRHSQEKFAEAGSAIKSLGLLECKVVSPIWVPVNYYTSNVYYMGEDIDSEIFNKRIILIFPCCETMDDNFNMSDIERYPYLYKSSDFVLIAQKGLTNKTCAKRVGYSSPMVEKPCELIGERFKKMRILNKIIEKGCMFINFKYEK